MHNVLKVKKSAFKSPLIKIIYLFENHTNFLWLSFDALIYSNRIVDFSK